MLTRAIADVTDPIITPTGERIAELIGIATPVRSTRHSIALVTLSAGKSSRLHMHPEAEESYFVTEGCAQVRIGKELLTVSEGSAVLIPSQTPHKIFNTAETQLCFMAVCVPAWEPTNTVWLE